MTSPSTKTPEDTWGVARAAIRTLRPTYDGRTGTYEAYKYLDSILSEGKTD